MRWAAWVLLLCASCIEDATVLCGELRCAAGSVCTPGGCATPEQVSACDGLAEEAACEAPGLINGHCLGGGCQGSICGNERIEFGELCDDGNVDGLDGCGPRCDSLEVCGNGVVDILLDEQCDDEIVGRSLDGCTSECTVELDTWRDATPSPISAREELAAAYDSDRGVVVMFGGSRNPQPLRDTWELRGTSWELRTPLVIPPARYGHVMAYDAMHRRTIMFGGLNTTGFLDDTWLWDGVAWTEVTTGPRPPARHHTALAYVGDGTTLLFGGNASDGSSLEDTWLFDGTQWTLLSASGGPGPRQWHAMARDTVSGDVVMYGGLPSNTETWAFRAGAWVRLSTSSLLGDRYNHRMTFDGLRNRVVIVGGSNTANGYVNVLAEWTGTAWANVGSMTLPAPRAAHALAFDIANNRLVVFGGKNDTGVRGDTLAREAGWLALPYDKPASRAVAGAAFDAARGEIVMFGGFGGQVFDDTWRWNGLQWLRSDPPTSPSARYAHTMTYDSKRQRVVMSGGVSEQGVFDPQLWGWDGDTWSVIPSTNEAPSVGGCGLAYDVDRDRLVRFGGTTSMDTVLGSTWEWDGTTWTDRMPASSPPPLSYPSMAYDRTRKRTMLHGGFDANAVLTATTYEWDGTTWTQLTPATQVPYGNIMYSEQRGRIVLVGAEPGTESDVWEWTGTDWESRPLVLAPTTNGAGVTAYDNLRGRVVRFGGEIVDPAPPTWTYGFESASHPPDLCTDSDSDGDGLASCADPDCTGFCDPLCNVGYCEPDRPRCGDGVCSFIEDHRRCATDCLP